jgi:hypothetical protein
MKTRLLIFCFAPLLFMTVSLMVAPPVPTLAAT